MAGFPKERNNYDIGHVLKNLPVPFPCLRAAINNEGPGRNKSAALQHHPGDRPGDRNNTFTQFPCKAFKIKERIATDRPGPALRSGLLPASC